MQNDTALSVLWGESLSFRTEGTSWGIMVLFFKDSTCSWAKVSYHVTNSSRISTQFRFRSCTRVSGAVARMRPAWLLGNFQIIKHFRYFIYSPVFKSAQLASEQVPFKQTYRRLEMICLYLMIPFAGNKMKKLFLVKFRFRRCCISVKMRLSRYFVSPHLALGTMWVWNPCSSIC